MKIDKNSSAAELRSELDRQRSRALELQRNMSDSSQWDSLNTIRWDLEDLDKDLYLDQFIKNNDKLEVLIGEIKKSSIKAEKISTTLEDVTDTLRTARAALEDASELFGELDGFYNEIEGLVECVKDNLGES